MLLNILELAFLIRERKLKEPFKMVIFSLAIADFVTLVGIFTVSFVWISNKTFLVALLGMVFFSIIASQLHIILITLQRFLAVLLPFRFKAMMTSRRCIICLVLVWSISLTLLAVQHFIETTVSLGILVYTVLVCGTCLVICYSFIVYLVLKERKKVTSSRAAFQQNMTVAIYSLSVTFVFVISNYPICNKNNSSRVAWSEIDWHKHRVIPVLGWTQWSILSYTF